VPRCRVGEFGARTAPWYGGATKRLPPRILARGPRAQPPLPCDAVSRPVDQPQAVAISFGGPRASRRRGPPPNSRDFFFILPRINAFAAARRTRNRRPATLRSAANLSPAAESATASASPAQDRFVLRPLSNDGIDVGKVNSGIRPGCRKGQLELGCD